MGVPTFHLFLLLLQLGELHAQLSLICSGISPTIPGRVTLYFGSRAAPSSEVAGGVKLRNSAGVETVQNFELQCAPPEPLDPALTTAAQWATAIIDGCSSGEAKGRLIGDSSSKITCYKHYPDIEALDSEVRSNLHFLAVGETNGAATDLVPSTAAGLVRSFWVVPIDGISTGWWAISQALDGPQPVEPCPDLIRGRSSREIYPCSLGLSGRWWWFHLAPAGAGKGCSTPVNSNKGRKSDIKSDNVAAFCSSAPDGFLCPIVCKNSRRPVGEVQCEDGSWSITLKCRPVGKVCLSGPSHVYVDKDGQSLQLSGIIPDARSECDLFTRRGKKCGGLCAPRGDVSTGQVKCRRSGGSAAWEALRSFDCQPASTDGLVNQPRIFSFQPGSGSLQIIADLVRDPSKVLSPVEMFYFRDPTGTMTCTAVQNVLELTRNSQNDEPDEPDLDQEDDAAEGGWDSCEADSDFELQSSQCFPDSAGGSECASCSGLDLENRECWSNSTRSRDCGNNPRSGDYLSCAFTGQFAGKAEVCFAKPPEGFCVKKVCAMHGSQKSCRSYNPPSSAQFCAGQVEIQEPIDHVVIRYACCNPNLVTVMGSCGGGIYSSGRRLQSDPNANVQIMPGAENRAGTSWGLPALVACAPISLANELNKDQYEIPEKCSRLMPGESCEVGCSSNYILQRKPDQGIFTCDLGMDRPPTGTFPECKLKPTGQNVVAGLNAEQAPTTTTTTIPALCQACADIGNFNDARFEQCRFWGDPHITKSWRPKSRFNFQDTGIHRYARTNQCAGNFEIHVFQCQYNSGRNAVATGFAARMNGNETIFISDRRVEASGGIYVEPDSGAILVDKTGVNVQSQDECVFFNVNVKHITKQPGFLHNFKLSMLAEDITADGICGAIDLKSQYIDPNSSQMIFTPQQHEYLCNQCMGAGATPPRGCVPDSNSPAPPPAAGSLPPGCDFVAPLTGTDQVCTTDDDPRYAQLEDNGQNCVVYAVLRRRKSCNDFCQERGSICVDAKDNYRWPCVFDEGKYQAGVRCSGKSLNDLMCVCRKPDNPNPGTTTIEACTTGDVTLQQAEALCKANDFLQGAAWPPRYEEAGLVTTTEQDELDDMLKDCMIDACSGGAEDAAILAQNLVTENPQVPVRSCAFTEGRQYEVGSGAYPCSCGGVECQIGEVCVISNDTGSCELLTTTATVTTFTVTSSATSTSSTASTFTSSSTTRTLTRSSTTSLTTTSLSTSSTSRTLSITSTTSLSATSTTSTSTTSGTSSSTTATGTSTTTASISSTSTSTSRTSSTTETSTRSSTSKTTSSTSSATSTATTATVTTTSFTSTQSQTTATSTSSTATSLTASSTSSTTASTSTTTATSTSTITVTSSTTSSSSSATSSSSSSTATSTSSTSTTRTSSSSSSSSSSSTITSSTSTSSTSTTSSSSSSLSSTTSTTVTTSSTTSTGSTTSATSTVTTSSTSTSTSSTSLTSSSSTMTTTSVTQTFTTSTTATITQTSTTSVSSTSSSVTGTTSSSTSSSTTGTSTSTSLSSTSSTLSTSTSLTATTTSRSSTSSTRTTLTNTLTGTSSTVTGSSTSTTSFTVTTSVTSTSTRSMTGTSTTSRTHSTTTRTVTTTSASTTSSTTTITVSTTSTSATTSTSRTRTSYTTSTTTTTATVTFVNTLACGPWNPSGGGVVLEWDGGDLSVDLLNDGNGWEWRVDMRKQVEGNDWFFVGHCSDFAFTHCEVWCLEPGATYDVRVQLASTVPELMIYDIFLSVVRVPYIRAGMPEDLKVLEPTSSSLLISWNASSQQGNCTFRAWQVEIRDPSGAWTKDPPACTSLSSFEEPSCTIINLPCQTAHIIQVRQLCWNEESTSEWSRPIAGSTLVTIGPSCLQAATLPSSLVATSPADGQLDMSWTAGSQEDSQFITWNVELYKTTFAGGQPDPEAEQQIDGVCQGLLDRTVTTCEISGLSWGMYSFAVQEVSALPATSSPLSALSGATWVARIPALTPTAVAFGEATQTSLQVSWTNSPLKDCIFQRLVVEIAANGSDFVAPAGCNSITDLATTTCVATGLQSWTTYTARVAVLCDECSETPTAERAPCSPEDGPDDRCLIPVAGGFTQCFRKLAAFRASSNYSEPSQPATTLPRREATVLSGTVQVPADSGQRVTLDWVPGVGSAGSPNITSDCTFQSWLVEIQIQSESVWAKPEGCLDLTDPMVTTCTAINLQCDTAYNARVQATCTSPPASSDWFAFPAFRTAYAGNCLRPASPPLLIRNTSRTATSITVGFIAGSPGDCVFDRFELTYRETSASTWTLAPATCGSLSVRLGPSCTISNLVQDTAYTFSARELCTNGAPLASPWGLTEEPIWTDLVPAVQAPSFLDPNGFISPSEPPTRLIVIFEVDLLLGDPSTTLSLCPMLLPSATPEDPGICNCGSAEDCAALCLTQANMQVELLSSRVLMAQFGSLLRPLTGCPYIALMEAGFLQTQLAPSRPSPRTEWSFIYWPPIPSGTLSLFSSTVTSLTVRVSWSVPMTTTCGVLVGSSTMQQTDPLDFTGSREFLEVRITGLAPFTQYTVICTGSAIGDPVVTATVSESGLSTAPDTNDRLSNIIVSVQAICTVVTTVNNSTNISVANVSQTLVPVVAAFTPVFDPLVRHYQLVLDAGDVRDLCTETEVEALFRIEVGAVTQSAFATASVDQPVQILVQPLPDATGFLPPEVPRSRFSQVRLVVEPPQQGQTLPQDYILDVVVGVLDVRLESAGIPTLLLADASSSAEFVISAPRGLEASSLGLRIGPFPQLLALVGAENYTENLLERTRYNFSAANLVGLGSQLTIMILVQPPPGSNFPTLEVRTVFVVSFQQPVVTSIETNMINNSVSLVQTTVITVVGTHLAVPEQFTTEPLSVEIFVAGVPANCTTSDCQEPALQALLDAGETSLCSDLGVVSTGTCTCSMEPTAHAQLAICLVLRTGFFAGRYCAAFGPPGSLQPGQPAVGGLSQPVQDMSSSEPFIVLVDGDLPWDNVSQGYLQVWATPLSEVPADVSNPGSGYQPLCSQAVRTDNNTIQCFRTQNFNVSQLGSQSNVYVQSGPDATSTNLVQGALQINQPRIFQITRSHEFEVGALEVTIQGEHFGTEANGNMVVQLETFGSNTQAVPDLSLAEDLGQTTHFVNCQIIDHQDKEVRCRVEDQSLFGAEVSGEYYNETIEVDEGRRLQEGQPLDLDRLALQLSQLPVAFSVFYELDCSILQRLNETCGSRPQNLSALAREWQAVRLKPCPAGERRSSYTGTDCIQCVPGKFKSGVGPALTCNTCEIGFYMGLFGAGACTVCPEHETTNITGATSISSCDCVPGYFRTNSGADWELASNHGVCRACPAGAICEGGPMLPYSASGYWTPDRLIFWPCFPSHACLQGDALDPNRCEESRDPASVRCGQCHADAFAHLSECHMCGNLDHAISWAGPFLGVIFLVFGFLPALIRSLRSMDMDHTKIQHRLLDSKHTSWLGRLAESDHGEFRMVIVMLTSLQTLWTVSLMPLPYTRFTKDWLWTMGIVAADMSILRPQCAFRLSYLSKWLLQWATFFIVVVVLSFGMLVYCQCHKNRLKDVGYISPKRGLLGVTSVTMMLFLLVHLRDDLVFLGCVPCEHDKFCLAFQPVIECAGTNWEWVTMMVLSILDLIFIILLSVPVIALCIYASWKWQHGKFRGLADDFSAPWYVFFSEFWVKRHRGYIQEVREAVPEFQKLFLNDDMAAASSREVWHRAIDLILAQEAEKADALLLRVISHMYTHSERFKMIDEDEGPAWEIIRSIRGAIRDRATRSTMLKVRSEPSSRSGVTSEVRADRPVPPETEAAMAQVATDRLNPMEEAAQVQQVCPDEPVDAPDVDKLKVSDVHHVKLTLDNLLDYARWSVPGARAIKRVLCYSWTVILLIARFVITIYAMLMRRDQSEVPLVYLLVTLAYVILGASLQPYVWAFLNDWEVAVHALIYVFLVFVISGWSDIASDVLVVVATMSAIVPVVLRVTVVLYGQEKEDPDEDPTVTQGSATYNLDRLALSEGTSLSRASSAVGPRSTGRSIQDAGRHREHVRNYIELVKRQKFSIVESTVDDDGQEVARASSTQAPAQATGAGITDGLDWGGDTESRTRSRASDHAEGRSTADLPDPISSYSM